MSELTQKVEQLRLLQTLKSSPGWSFYYTNLSQRQIVEQLLLTEPPDVISSAKRDYIAGKVRGMAESVNLIDVLIGGLTEEIELLREQESKDARSSDTSDHDTGTRPSNGAGSDPHASPFGGASPADPFADSADR
jgi:hypothetical protein